MRRRSKDEENPDAAGPEAEMPEEGGLAEIDSRLSPLEEFRAKSDQWMKETSAQLARVATHVQQDEKRQQRLDERLAEFEDRIQSMLTLTEALSLGDNPFVRPHEGASFADDGQTGSRQATPEPEKALSLSDESPGPSAWREEEGEPLDQELVRVRTETHEGNAPDPQTEEQAHSSTTRTETEGPSGRKQGAARTHPNDALVEEDLDLPEDDTSYLPHDSAPATPLDDSPSLEAGAAQEVEQRLVLLQWANLLARHMHRIDLDAFLETYLHTRWVSHTEVEKVRALAVDLARHASAPTEKLTREDLHIRTILLLSRLSTRSARGPSRALRLVEDARSIAQAPWLPAER